MISNYDISQAMTIKLDLELPEVQEFKDGIRRAPDRGFSLTPAQTKIALKNALAMFRKNSMRRWPRNFWRNCGLEVEFMLIVSDRLDDYLGNPSMNIRETAQKASPFKS